MEKEIDSMLTWQRKERHQEAFNKGGGGEHHVECFGVRTGRVERQVEAALPRSKKE